MSDYNAVEASLQVADETLGFQNVTLPGSPPQHITVPSISLSSAPLLEPVVTLMSDEIVHETAPYAEGTSTRYHAILTRQISIQAVPIAYRRELVQFLLNHALNGTVTTEKNGWCSASISIEADVWYVFA